MGKSKYVARMNPTEMRKLLDEIPNDLKLDIVQLALDLAGVVNPVADAASALLSLARGDLLGFGIGVVSVIPIGDVAKLGKFGKYRKSLTRLVDVATKNPRLARAIEPVVEQIGALLDQIQGFVGKGDTGAWLRELDLMRDAIARYRLYLRNVKLVASQGVARVARSKGFSSAAGQYAIRRGDKYFTANVDQVVDMLEAATQTGPTPIGSKQLQRASRKNGDVKTLGRHSRTSLQRPIGKQRRQSYLFRDGRFRHAFNRQSRRRYLVSFATRQTWQSLGCHEFQRESEWDQSLVKSRSTDQLGSHSRGEWIYEPRISAR